MRLAKHPRKRRMEMDMTPMIDVAFQLIIFFMTVSQMTDANQERLQLPKQTGMENQQPKSMTINITNTGELRMEGKATPLAGMVSRVSQELQTLGDDPTKLHIVIRADERCESRSVNDVVTALGRMRLTKIRIAVQSGESG